MNKTDYKLIALALIGFLFFQAILVYYARLTDYDEAVFLDIARNIHRVGQPLRSVGLEGWLYFIHTPLYLYLVSGSVSLVGDSPLWTRMVTMLFGIASIFLTYMIVRQQQTAVSSFVAAMLLALNTFFAIYAYFLTMAVPMAFFILLTIYWLAKVENTAFWDYLGAGVSAALAVMLKELALIFVAATALYVFIIGRTWRERIVQPVCIVLPTVVALVMWFLWGINLNKSAFVAGVSRWIGLADGGNNIAGTRDLQTITWIRVLSEDLFSWGILILFVFAVFAYFFWFRRKLPQIIWLLFLYLGLATGLSFFISLKEPRHVIALIPVMALIIGMMVKWELVWAWVTKKPVRFVMATFITLLLVWNISPLKLPAPTEWRQVEKWWEPKFAQRIFYSQRYYEVLKDTGQYLVENTPPNTVVTVMHEGPVVGYYADRPHYFLYTMPFPQVLEFLEDAEYLVADRQSFPKLTPEENDVVMAYIKNNFEVAQILESRNRQVIVYHRP